MIPVILQVSLFTISVMVVISGIMYFSEKEKLQWFSLEYWLVNGFYFFVTLLTNEGDPIVVALPTIIWIWRVRTIRNILSYVSKTELKKYWHIFLLIPSYLFSLYLALQDYPLMIFTLPQSIAQFVVMLDIIIRSSKEMKKHEISINHYLLLLTGFLITVHSLDYPFLRLDPIYSDLGFYLVLVSNMLMAIVLPAVTIYELRKEQQEKLENLIHEREELLVSQAKYSTLGAMAAGIVHEINGPLSIVSHRTSHLRNQLLRDRAEKDFLMKGLEQIELTNERMSKIVNSLRKFSRDAVNESFQRVALATVIEDTLSYCYDRFQNANILIDVEPYPPVDIECRSVQISQVILNLLNNAFDAIQDKQNPWVRIIFEQRPETVVIKVIDSGSGIPEVIRRKIMEPFFSTKVSTGTGLGLSISKGLVEEHQGKLYYDEAFPNTCFVVELPYNQKK